MIPRGEETGPPGVSEYATHYGAQHACTQKQARRGRSIRACKYERRSATKEGNLCGVVGIFLGRDFEHRRNHALCARIYTGLPAHVLACVRMQMVMAILISSSDEIDALSKVDKPSIP